MNIYQGMMKTAVRIKRILTGKSSQTDFTRYIEEIQFKTPEELKSLQAVSLCELLKHAVNHIPYYMDIKDNLGLTPQTAFDDIKKVPIISKGDLIKGKERFLADNIELGRIMHTGGTTGEKAFVHEDKYFSSHGPDEYFNKVIGMVPGKSRLILKDDISKKKAVIQGKYDYEFNPLKQVYRIDHKFLDDRKMEFITGILKKNKPKIIWGDSYAVYVLAKYIRKNNIKFKFPEALLLGGQLLLSHNRKIIEEVFKAPVYERYGSTECANTANQCLEQEGFHYVPVVHYLEILDDDNNPVKNGETGNLIITTLNKRGQPMIRYNIGDQVEYTEKTCPCGCNFPIFKNIVGMRKEGFVSPKGTYMTTTAIYMVFKDLDYIHDFQAIQIEPGVIILNLVTGSEICDDDKKYIKKEICARFDYDMDVRIKRVTDVKPLPNGKVLRGIPYSRFKELGDYFNEIV